MKLITQFEIPAHESGPVVNYRREPHEASNDTGRTIPADHVVKVRIESGELRIVADLGRRR